MHITDYGFDRVTSGKRYSAASTVTSNISLCRLDYLVNAPATFQEYINASLEILVDIICIVYLDDILIYSNTDDDLKVHEAHVKQVLQSLRKASLFVNLDKCKFSCTKVDFLGYVITRKGISMEPSRVDAIATWPIPSSVLTIQSFLGFTGFYRRFIESYSKTVVPLTNRLRGQQPAQFQLQPDELAAFRQLQQRFQEAPLLVHFDPLLPIRVETDASGHAIGAILSMLLTGQWHPIAFYSRKLTDTELRYTTPDAELLAIQEAFRVWRNYLAYSSHPVKVITDHLNHKYLISKPKLTPKQVTVLDELCPFNFVIEHRPGTLNPADALSRRADYIDRQEGGGVGLAVANFFDQISICRDYTT